MFLNKAGQAKCVSLDLARLLLGKVRQWHYAKSESWRQGLGQRSRVARCSWRNVNTVVIATRL